MSAPLLHLTVPGLPQPQGSSRLRPVPCSMEMARQYVATLHRHHTPPRSGLFAVACADDEGRVHGVAVVSRPVARLLDDGMTAEVTRVATDGTRNVCSVLYGACFRAAKALGYVRIFTYTRVDEPGTSLKASGWTLDDPAIRARSWNMPGRARIDKTEIIQRKRWVRELNDALELVWPHRTVSNQQELFA